MKLAMAVGWRYEPEQLVEDWKENTKWADFHIIVDDRDRDPNDLWDNEAERYRKYRRLAMEAGADWLFVTAPDERLGRNAEKIMRGAMEKKTSRIAYDFRVLELYSPTQYRCDGHWDSQYHSRMYKLDRYQMIADKTLHADPVPCQPKHRHKIIGVDIYHLKHIEPENRRIRTEVFKQLDPEGKLGGLGAGYDYLDDEKNIELKTIPKDDMYLPPYRKPYLFNPTLPQEP